MILTFIHSLGRKYAKYFSFEVDLEGSFFSVNQIIKNKQ
jgi:hypothetical protein